MRRIIDQKLKSALSIANTRTRFLIESGQDPSKDSKLHYLDGVIETLESLLKIKTQKPKLYKLERNDQKRQK